MLLAGFLKKARTLHGNRYDYSQVEYSNNKTKIKIVCTKHGVFEQRPSQHTQQKQGCPACGLEESATKRTLTTDKFVDEAKKIFSNNYDYTNTQIVTLMKQVSITCPTHGMFKILPKNHLKGIGCPSCQQIVDIEPTQVGKLYVFNDLITRSNYVHSNRYDYSKVIYTNMNKPVVIICKEHGEFEQTFSKHLYRERGCPACGGTKKMTTNQFIEKAKQVHKDKYDYSDSNYIDTESKVVIICQKHGKFEQTAKKHLSGQGCAKCRSYKYNRQKIISSKCCADWLKYISAKLNVDIQSADNGGEYIYMYNDENWFSFDGYCAESNTCFEFYGDFFHGNPSMYHEDKLYPLRQGVTMGDLYKKTISRENVIRSAGFNLITIWEKEWRSFIETVIMIQRRWRRNKYN